MISKTCKCLNRITVGGLPELRTGEYTMIPYTRGASRVHIR